MHPTSFPGAWDTGVLGGSARQFIDALVEMGAVWWQVLPLGPTGYGDSPYQSFSAFAGNPYLIDPQYLINKGWLEGCSGGDFPLEQIDFGSVYQTRWPLLRKAFEGFAADEDFDKFCEAEQSWLNDYALFMALKNEAGGGPWNSWEPDIRTREHVALEAASTRLSSEVRFYKWLQWIFFAQWGEIKNYANQHGVKIIGDMPIFVALDSSDVWSHQDQFYLDADSNPEVVAGVPPDYFSPTGQLWGNPIYRWDKMEQNGFAWWIDRVASSLKIFDLVRIDHFRGFEAYWEIPAGAPTAETGEWVKSPGHALFAAIQKVFSDAPIIAEDLGLITPEVEQLRDDFGFPGMKILQFAFSDEENPFLPINFPPDGNVIAYTGSHDNETARGWYNNAPEGEKKFALGYMTACGIKTQKGEDFSDALVKLTLESGAKVAVVQMQDLLDLGNEARMNYPGKAEGNWAWRMQPGAIKTDRIAAIRKWVLASKRLV